MTQTVRYSATVYPYHKGFFPYLLHAPLLAHSLGVRIHRLVSPQGYGYDQQDAGYADQNQSLQHEVGSDLTVALDASNSLLLLDADPVALPREELLTRAREAIEQGNHLLCCMRLCPEESTALASLCKQNHVDFVEAHKRFEDVPFSRSPRQDWERMERLPVPVVGVGNLLPKLNGAEAALALTSHFARQGYRALPLLTGDLSCLVCRYCVEDILYDDTVNPVDKVIQLNRWLMEVYERERPDIIVLQFPGDLVAIDSHMQTTHGLYAYMLSQAIGIDAFVLCLPHNFVDSRGLENLTKLLHYRFFLSPDAIFLSNKVLDTGALIQQRRIEYMHIPMESVLAYTQSQNDDDSENPPLFSGGEMDRLCAHIEETLAQYSMADPTT